MAFSPAAALARSRAGRALSRPHNWVQLAKFSAVGASGYVINLAVYTALLRGAGFHYTSAATSAGRACASSSSPSSPTPRTSSCSAG